MLIISATTLREAWEKSFLTLYREGNTLTDPEILKDDVLLLEISDPFSEEKYHPLFPMEKDVLDEYNRYVVHGGAQGNVLGEHALYHERLFSFPPDGNNQIEAVVQKLKSDPFSKRAQATLWYPDIDQKEKKVPCLQIMWFRIENGKLVMHCHMRANDAYRKLLMNLNIFTEVMKYIAGEINVSPGKYVHFVDSFHLYKADAENIDEVAPNLGNTESKG